jgi:hypothetical protein
MFITPPESAYSTEAVVVYLKTHHESSQYAAWPEKRPTGLGSRAMDKGKIDRKLAEPISHGKSRNFSVGNARALAGLSRSRSPEACT